MSHTLPPLMLGDFRPPHPLTHPLWKFMGSIRMHSTGGEFINPRRRGRAPPILGLNPPLQLSESCYVCMGFICQLMDFCSAESDLSTRLNKCIGCISQRYNCRLHTVHSKQCLDSCGRVLSFFCIDVLNVKCNNERYHTRSFLK